MTRDRDFHEGLREFIDARIRAALQADKREEAGQHHGLALAGQNLVGTVMEAPVGGKPVIRLNGDEIDIEYDLVEDGLSLAKGDRVLIHRWGRRLLVAHKRTPTA